MQPFSTAIVLKKIDTGETDRVKLPKVWKSGRTVRMARGRVF